MENKKNRISIRNIIESARDESEKNSEFAKRAEQILEDHGVIAPHHPAQIAIVIARLRMQGNFERTKILFDS